MRSALTYGPTGAAPSRPVGSRVVGLCRPQQLFERLNVLARVSPQLLEGQLLRPAVLELRVTAAGVAKA